MAPDRDATAGAQPAEDVEPEFAAMLKELVRDLDADAWDERKDMVGPVPHWALIAEAMCELADRAERAGIPPHIFPVMLAATAGAFVGGQAEAGLAGRHRAMRAVSMMLFDGYAAAERLGLAQAIPGGRA